MKKTMKVLSFVFHPYKMKRYLECKSKKGEEERETYFGMHPHFFQNSRQNFILQRRTSHRSSDIEKRAHLSVCTPVRASPHKQTNTLMVRSAWPIRVCAHGSRDEAGTYLRYWMQEEESIHRRSREGERKSIVGRRKRGWWSRGDRCDDLERNRRVGG